MTQKGEERKKPRAELWGFPVFQELAEEETRLRETELDQPKRSKSSEDNSSIDAQGPQVGSATCLFQVKTRTPGFAATLHAVLLEPLRGPL